MKLTPAYTIMQSNLMLELGIIERDLKRSKIIDMNLFNQVAKRVKELCNQGLALVAIEIKVKNEYKTNSMTAPENEKDAELLNDWT